MEAEGAYSRRLMVFRVALAPTYIGSLTSSSSSFASSFVECHEYVCTIVRFRGYEDEVYVRRGFWSVFACFWSQGEFLGLFPKIAFLTG